ncbi:MAG TPA: very short patch repair endonuclease [Flavobacteriales bacterium]|nr:very short patch repair endonuclease [Flavobacteriales bacterium]
MSKTYLRDGRAPIPKDARTSALMSRIRGSNTGPEKALRAALSAEGIKGYRLNYAKAPGRPDVAFVGRKVALFVHGCFWHGCPHCQPQRPKTNRTFWREKLDRNKARDRRKVRELRKAGWRVTTIWECRLRERPMVQVQRVVRALDG